MFELLDKTLKALFDDVAGNVVLTELANAEISFLTPAAKPAPARETVNLFLYETKENRELREVAPTLEKRNGVNIRRRPPLRVDCAYLVTTWSSKQHADKIEAEHRLLAQAFNWLSHFPLIPERHLRTAGMMGQVFPPPTLVAQMDAAKNVGEFWSALGIPPRPFFNLIVTITMDLELAFEDSIVTAISSRYRQIGANAEDELMIIGGTVRDAANIPVPDAWVRLEPVGMTHVTDASGHFIFDHLERGANYRLRARAQGHADFATSNFEIPSLTGTYDLQLT